jgi:predicted nucleotidyltransferase
LLFGKVKDKVNVLTSIDCAEKYKGLRTDYDMLSEYAHPNAKSHFSSFMFSDDRPGHFEFYSGNNLDAVLAREFIRVTAQWTEWFLETVRVVDRELLQIVRVFD